MCARREYATSEGRSEGGGCVEGRETGALRRSMGDGTPFSLPVNVQTRIQSLRAYLPMCITCTLKTRAPAAGWRERSSRSRAVRSGVEVPPRGRCAAVDANICADVARVFHRRGTIPAHRALGAAGRWRYDISSCRTLL